MLHFLIQTHHCKLSNKSVKGIWGKKEGKADSQTQEQGLDG